MKTQAGDRFTVSIADGVVLMEARSLRCGDVWDCYPVNTGGDYADEYGHHMIFTDEQVASKSGRHNQWRKDVGAA
jgi:hypothetical protein